MTSCQCANCIYLYDAMQAVMRMKGSMKDYLQLWKEHQDYARIYQCPDFWPEREFRLPKGGAP